LPLRATAGFAAVCSATPLVASGAGVATLRRATPAL